MQEKENGTFIITEKAPLIEEARSETVIIKASLIEEAKSGTFIQDSERKGTFSIFPSEAFSYSKESAISMASGTTASTEITEIQDTESEPASPKLEEKKVTFEKTNEEYRLESFANNFIKTGAPVFIIAAISHLESTGDKNETKFFFNALKEAFSKLEPKEKAARQSQLLSATRNIYTSKTERNLILDAAQIKQPILGTKLYIESKEGQFVSYAEQFLGSKDESKDISILATVKESLSHLSRIAQEALLHTFLSNISSGINKLSSEEQLKKSEQVIEIFSDFPDAGKSVIKELNKLRNVKPTSKEQQAIKDVIERLKLAVQNEIGKLSKDNYDSQSITLAFLRNELECAERMIGYIGAIKTSESPIKTGEFKEVVTLNHFNFRPENEAAITREEEAKIYESLYKSMFRIFSLSTALDSENEVNNVSADGGLGFIAEKAYARSQGDISFNHLSSVHIQEYYIDCQDKDTQAKRISELFAIAPAELLRVKLQPNSFLNLVGTLPLQNFDEKQIEQLKNITTKILENAGKLVTQINPEDITEGMKKRGLNNIGDDMSRLVASASLLMERLAEFDKYKGSDSQVFVSDVTSLVSLYENFRPSALTPEAKLTYYIYDEKEGNQALIKNSDGTYNYRDKNGSLPQDKVKDVEVYGFKSTPQTECLAKILLDAQYLLICAAKLDAYTDFIKIELEKTHNQEPLVVRDFPTILPSKEVFIGNDINSLVRMSGSAIESGALGGTTFVNTEYLQTSKEIADKIAEFKEKHEVALKGDSAKQGEEVGEVSYIDSLIQTVFQSIERFNEGFLSKVTQSAASTFLSQLEPIKQAFEAQLKAIQI